MDQDIGIRYNMYNKSIFLEIEKLDSFEKF